MWTRKLAGTGLALLALAGALFAVTFIKRAAGYVPHLRIASAVALFAALWFGVEAVRFGYWQRHYLYSSDGASYRPAPRYMTTMIRSWLSHAVRAVGRSVRGVGRRLARRFRRSRH